MARADHGNIQFSHALQCFEHVWLERSDDAVKIVFGSTHIALMICHLAYQDIMEAVMGTKGITGHKNLFFLNKGIHGIRPVQVRNDEETQSLAADFHGLVVFYGNGTEITVYDFLQETDGAARGNDLHLRAVVQKLLDASCMIRLGVLYHQIIDFCDIDDFF